MNVATYGPGGRFAMTDRGEAALGRSRDRLTIGPSSMTWEDGRLTIEIDEISSPPLVSRMQGTVTVTPVGVSDRELPLTPDGAHVWRPFAPSARIEVDLGPRGRWSGHGYFDANFGTRALEADFSRWSWGRFPLADGGAACFYDAVRRDGTDLSAGIRFAADGTARETPPPPRQPLRRSLWGLGRETRGEPGAPPRQALAMLDAPFYCRSAVTTTLEGHETTGVHEALDLDRFRSRWLMPMLAVRVPRRRHWGPVS